MPEFYESISPEQASAIYDDNNALFKHRFKKKYSKKLRGDPYGIDRWTANEWAYVTHVIKTKSNIYNSQIRELQCQVLGSLVADQVIPEEASPTFAYNPFASINVFLQIRLQM